MIKNIGQLRNFGIFKEFQNKNHENAKDFEKYNLFFGWNGSGKSTLSDLFRCMEEKTVSKPYCASEFEVITTDKPLITQKNVVDHGLNVRVFNRQFIEENISWNDVVTSILLVDEKKIDERKTLEEKRQKQKEDEQTLKNKYTERKKLENNIDDFCISKAKDIKKLFLELGVNDNRYLNYDKRSFKKSIDDKLQETSLANHLLDNNKKDRLEKAVKSNQKSQITIDLTTIDQETFAEHKKNLDGLLEKNVVSQTIDRLVKNSHINNWVKTGLEIHKDINQCEFCGNTITQKRIEELEAHFNDDYKELQTSLENARQALERLANKYNQSSNTLPPASGLYEEFEDHYKERVHNFDRSQKKLCKEIKDWLTVLKQKKNDIFKTDLTINAISIEAFNDAVKAIDEIVKKHNGKLENFEQEISKAKNQLEMHYVATEAQSFNYFNKKKELSMHEKEKRELNEKIKK